MEIIIKNVSTDIYRPYWKIDSEQIDKIVQAITDKYSADFARQFKIQGNTKK